MVVPAAGGGGFGVGEVFQPVAHGVVVVDPGVLQAGHTGGRAGVGRAAAAQHVAEAPVLGVLAAAHVADGAVDGFFGNADPGVAGAAQRHDLGDGDRQVRVVGLGMVAPAALVVLAIDDQPNGADERGADLGGVDARGRAAVDLAEKQRRVAVAVHRSVAGVGGEQARLVGVGQHELQGALHRFAAGPAAGQVAVGQQRQARDGGDAHVPTVAPAAETAIVALHRRQPREAALDGSAGGGRHLFEGGRGLGALGRGRHRGHGQRRGQQRQREGGDNALK